MAIEEFTLQLVKAQQISDERGSEVKEVHTYSFPDTWETDLVLFYTLYTPFGSVKYIV